MMAERPRYLLSLGDRVSMDAYAGGPGRGAASLLYQNRDTDFPDWAGRDLKTHLPGSRLIPLAMDGGTSATVRYAQLPRFAEMSVKAAVVTITMGGSDLFQIFGNESAVEAAHQALKENGAAILVQLRKLAERDAPILLGTLCQPSDGTDDAAHQGLWGWSGALPWIARFNTTLRGLAEVHDARLVDLHTGFEEYGPASGKIPAQPPDPRPVNQGGYGHGVIEPNAQGASAIRAAWWQALLAADFLHEKR
ncbi:MAG: SGNH/GDSL hydrolase family protein [Cytophagales bacterium]|nr:SGNH/GDSL hydrolase family protein [Armatimonadota bacterium]